MLKFLVLSLTGVLTMCAPRAVRAGDLTVCSSGCSHVQINAAIQAASCGDTIRISAAETHYGGDANPNANNPILLRHKDCPTGNPITLTTSEAAKLPPSGSRITPSYAGAGSQRVVPLIVNPAYGPILKAELGNQACGGGSQPSCPAHDYTLVGLEFCCQAHGYSDFVQIGSTENGSSEPLLKSIEDLPYNIVLDRVLVRSDPRGRTRKCVSLDGNNMRFENSWVDCGYDTNSSDSQGINSFHGQDLVIRNNYISGTTETMNFSGACSPIHTPKERSCSTSDSGAMPRNIEIAFNHITKPLWVRMENWAAGKIVVKGKLNRPTAYGAPFQAQNAGRTGSSEPAWPTSPGATVVDGEVTWQLLPGAPQAKNLLEIKAGENINIHHNLLQTSYAQGQQGYAMTFTTRSIGSSGGGNWSYIRNVRVENNVVTDVGSGLNTSGRDISDDPNAYASILTANLPPYEIAPDANKLQLQINGATPVTIVLTPGSKTAEQIVAEINAQLTTGGKACVWDGRLLIRATAPGDGPSACFTVQSPGVSINSRLAVQAVDANAYAALGLTVGTTSPCTNPATGQWYGCGGLSGLVVRNNLWSRIGLAPNTASIGYVFSFFNALRDVDFSHNTVDSEKMGTMFELASESLPNSNVKIKHNILRFRGENLHPFGAGGILYDFSAINYMLCNVPVTDTVSPIDSLCPAGTVSRNLIPNVSLWSGPTRDTRPYATNSGFGSFPKDNWNDHWENVEFKNPNELDYELTTSSKFRNSAIGGASIGADVSKLPLIRNFVVTATDRAASFSFDVSEPSLAIPCQIQVSPDAALASIIPDLDPFRYTHPESSQNDSNTSTGAHRVMLIGRNVPLEPNTRYYYHLGCGGAARQGHFDTLNTLAGNRPFVVKRTAKIPDVASMLLIWGYDFTKSTGILSPTVNASACTFGSLCQIGTAGTAGQPIFYQVQYLDASNNVLRTEPVLTLALR